MTEQQMREAEAPTHDTSAELAAYIDSLTEREHDYGTCVYAMSLAAVAAFNHVARKLGVTGFQASCADMDIIRRTRRFTSGFRILDYGDLLYPQYRDKFDSCAFDALLVEHASDLAKQARQKLAESPNAHPDALAHWALLAAYDEERP